jgi:hypothetical protein
MSIGFYKKCLPIDMWHGCKRISIVVFTVVSSPRPVLDTDADRQRLDLALSESHRLKHLLPEILSYAKPQVLQLTRLQIGEFLNDLLLQVRDLPEAIDRQIDGLGLAISQRIIVAHGGELTIVSADSGTTVNVLLPII